MAPLLNSFIRIGPRTSLFTPQEQTSGQLVILCTWLGASPKHISKYTALYEEIAPKARILLIESDVPIIVSSYVKQREAIKPAVSAVLDTMKECANVSSTEAKSMDPNRHSTVESKADKPTPQILLHVFSNGGTTIVAQLLLALNCHLGAPLPLVGLLCDSCPAKGTYWRSYNAMVLSLPKDLATRLLGAMACHCILVTLYTCIACGYENPAHLQRRMMLDEDTVSASHEGITENIEGEKPAGRVCYFYSKEDRMCLWSDIRHHADEARILGWDVREVVFEGSGHCAHFPQDEKRYADAVKSIWDGGKSKGSKTEVAKL